MVDKSSYRLSVGCFLRCKYNRNCIMFGDLNGVSWGDGGTTLGQSVFTEGIQGLELSGGTVIVAEGGRIGGEVVIVQEVY